MSLLGLIILSAQFTCAQELKTDFDLGIEKYNTKHFKEAIQKFAAAIHNDKNFADAYYERGRCYHELKSYVPAINDFTKTIELNPKHTKAYYIRGYTRFLIGNYRGAIEDFTATIDLKNNSALAYSYRGESLFALGQEKRACTDWMKAHELGYQYVQDLMKAHCSNHKLSLEQYADQIISVGDEKFNKNELNEAVAEYNKAIQIYPESGNGYFSRGFAYLLLGEKEQACTDWIKAENLKNNEAANMIKQHCK